MTRPLPNKQRLRLELFTFSLANSMFVVREALTGRTLVYFWNSFLWLLFLAIPIPLNSLSTIPTYFNVGSILLKPFHAKRSSFSWQMFNDALRIHMFKVKTARQTASILRAKEMSSPFLDKWVWALLNMPFFISCQRGDRLTSLRYFSIEMSARQWKRWKNTKTSLKEPESLFEGVAHFHPRVRGN